MWSEDDERQLSLIRAHTMNNIRHLPDNVDLNDKLWLIRKIDSLRLELESALWSRHAN